ncbi:hypothetical protein NMY22_g6407 [Coprinellus aureogranulatus]|nr:hypothetical protein NMY22_g6407 [Coprinellus aureogranulatus]
MGEVPTAHPQYIDGRRDARARAEEQKRPMQTHGCEHPVKCRRNAEHKLGNLEPEWDPRIALPHLATHSYSARECGDGWIPATISLGNNEHPLTLVRVFTNRSDPPAPSMIQLRTRTTTAIPRPDGIIRRPTIWTDGSCIDNGTMNAKAGSGLWYGQDSNWNLAMRVDSHVQSNNAGEVAAVATALQRHHDAKTIKIVSDSSYTIDAMTVLARKRLDHGYEGVANALLIASLTAELLTTGAKVLVKKVKGHSGDEGNEGADRLAAEGVRKQISDPIDTSMGEELLKIGTRLQVSTQSLLYTQIRRYHPAPTRATTRQMVEQATTAIEALTGSKPPPERLWNALRTRAKSSTLSQKFCAWAWKGLHDAHKIGDYWRRGSGYEARAECSQCNVQTESLHHILFECRMTNQRLVWDAVKNIWDRTRKEWPDLSVGTVLGIGLAEIKRDNGRKDPGLTRLYQILISEAAYLIWLLRCEWRLEREANPARVHTAREVLSRLRTTIERRMRTDRILTRRRTYGKKALSSRLVTGTWRLVTHRDHPNHVLDLEGVLAPGPAVEKPPKNAWRPSPVYTFLATLVLLLSVSAAIVIRSFILRRRHRLLVEEAMRNGTFIPGTELDGGVGGGGPMGAGRWRGRVDLSKKPRMWDVSLGGGGVYYGQGGSGYANEKAGWEAVGGDVKEWDAIKPVSVSYVASTLPSKAGSTSDTGSQPNSNQPPQDERRRGLVRRAGTFVADLFRPPRPAAPSNTQSNTTSGSNQVGEEENGAPSPDAIRRGGQTFIETRYIGEWEYEWWEYAFASERGFRGDLAYVGASSFAFNVDSSLSFSPLECTIPVNFKYFIPLSAEPVSSSTLTNSPPHPNPHLDEEQPLPVLEIGVAEVTVASVDGDGDGEGSGESARGKLGDGDGEGRE